MPSAPHAGTVLAFDFGTQRIGVAVGDIRLRLAHPLTTIENAATGQHLGAIATLIAEWKPALLVVGLPSDDICFSPVMMRFTTHGATTALREAGARGAKRKGARDRVAAQLILQAYFDQRQPA